MTEQIKHVYLGDLTVKRGEDGYLRVKGLATDDTLDLDEQICDPDWLRKAMPAWMEIGNIREMHGAKAVGKAMEMTQSGNGFVVEAKIVDKEAAMKVEEDIYTGFSVGIKGARVVKDSRAPGGRIVDGTIVEVSLVDRPANPSAVIEIAKSVNGELIKGEAVDEKFAATPAMNTEMVMSEVPINADVDEPRSDSFQPCTVCGGSGHKSNIDANALTEIRCERCDGSGREPEGEHEQIMQDSPSNPSLSDDVNHEVKGTEPEVEKKDYSDKERAEMAEAGMAMPGGGYPIKTVKDLKNAIQAYGRAKDPEAAKKHIKERAVALGRADLIPDNWKAFEPDLTKADDAEHNVADLNAVRASLIALIKAELDEMLAGDENEVGDVQELLTSLQIFLNWWTDEASENETVAPFTGWDEENKEAPIMMMGATADLAKTVVAELVANDKTELRDEIRKALGVDEEIATYKAALEDMAKSVHTLTADLQEIREMAAPGGPALRQTGAQANKSAQVEALKVEAERRRIMASQVTDPGLRNAYLDAAVKLEAQAADLA